MVIEPEKLRSAFDKSWYELLKPEMEKDYFQNAMGRLKEETVAKHFIFPKFKDMFRPWLLPFDKVRVVIVAEQPNKQSDGLAFSTRDMPELPFETLELFKEIYFSNVLSKQLGVELNDVFCCGDLTQWMNQGVMLMNYNLTTSNNIIDWKEFTNFTLRFLNMKEEPIVFIFINTENFMIDSSKHEVIIVDKVKDSKCFIKCNNFLKERYPTQPNINWGVWPAYCQQYVFKVMNDDWKEIDRLKDQVKQEWRIPIYFKGLLDRFFGTGWFESLTMFDSDKLKKWVQVVSYSAPLKNPKKGKEYEYLEENFLYWMQQIGSNLDENSILQITIE